MKRRTRRIGGKNLTKGQIGGKKLTKGQFGGKKLGEGQFGAVYSPPLKCQEGDDDTWASPKYASKTIFEDDLEKEYRNSFLVKALDHKNAWSLTAIHACTIHKSQPNANYKPALQNRQLIFQNGGKSLSDLLVKPGVKGHWSEYTKDAANFKYLDSKALPQVIKQLKQILPGLEQLNTRYTHNDLHFGNIVTDGKTPRIIDFASLQPIDETMAEERKLMAGCLTIKEKKDGTCAFLPDRLKLLMEDEAKSRDVQTLWSDLYSLLDSNWVKATFPNKYSTWLTKYEHLARFINFCPEYVLSIMNVPA